MVEHCVLRYGFVPCKELLKIKKMDNFIFSQKANFQNLKQAAEKLGYSYELGYTQTHGWLIEDEAPSLKMEGEDGKSHVFVFSETIGIGRNEVAILDDNEARGFFFVQDADKFLLLMGDIREAYKEGMLITELAKSLWERLKRIWFGIVSIFKKKG